MLITLNELAGWHRGFPELRQRAAAFLGSAQKESGGWGGDKNAPASIEESAVALEALIEDPEYSVQVARGTEWLLDQLEAEEWKKPAPIGLYFARLWYYERLYPLIFSVSALGKLRLKQG